MINRVELKNFGPIEQLDWQNLGKINLIIGNNGCGKSYLLKALYSAMKTIEEYKRGDNPETDFDILWRKLYWTFQAEKIGDLVSNRSEELLSFKMLFDDDEFSYSFDKKIEKLNSIFNQVPFRSSNSIYLPAKEVLSLFHIILASSENSKLFGFDNTYVDLTKALLGRDYTLRRLVNALDDSLENKEIYNLFLSSLKGKKESSEILSKFFASESGLESFNFIANELSKIHVSLLNTFQDCREKLLALLGGKIEYNHENNRWYFKKGEQLFSMGETAEGIKKIGVLDTLLENEYLSQRSIVFIDEPESNLHPQAISQLLDIIAMLANHGIQFFMASHSYFVIKKLFLIAQEQQMSIPVLSYQNNEWVQSDLKDDLPDNPIVDESIRLYEEQLDLAGV